MCETLTLCICEDVKLHSVFWHGWNYGWYLCLCHNHYNINAHENIWDIPTIEIPKVEAPTWSQIFAKIKWLKGKKKIIHFGLRLGNSLERELVLGLGTWELRIEKLWHSFSWSLFVFLTWRLIKMLQCSNHDLLQM